MPYERAGDISALLNTSIHFTSTPIIALISKKAIASEDLGAVHLGQLLLQNNANASKIAHIKLSLEKEISEIEFLLYDPTLMECLLKIHESNFFYLHDQYREIAVRDGGINSRDGWLKLQLPEYYILKNRKDKGYDIIRYAEKAKYC